eukprot:TRINITY_DN20259_c0_g1_i1.p1 TRINITY_DN20259_c0_g1~~TRINITY_DN20259_c0_g1_i1.p1  ORF type:complete len:743 (+),score=40.56 TRINITY_DN20259_c0_g1_i1:32-2260(+)
MGQCCNSGPVQLYEVTPTTSEALRDVGQTEVSVNAQLGHSSSTPERNSEAQPVCSGAKASSTRPGKWFTLGGDQKLPIRPEQWMPYNDEVSFILSQANSVVQDGDQAMAMLLDLSMFTDPPLPYNIYRCKPAKVCNPNAQRELKGKTVAAGYPVELWKEPMNRSSLLPANAKMGCVIPYFIQVHHDSVQDLYDYNTFLADESGSMTEPISRPRRRAVILVEFPVGVMDVNRFAKRKVNPTQPSAPSSTPQSSNVDAEVVTMLDDKLVAVYEWWFGSSPPQSQLTQGTSPVGHWKMYHPRVCLKLEESFQNNKAFKAGESAIDVDGIRYMLQHVTHSTPFSYVGKPSREPFTDDLCITVSHPCFTDMDRRTDNCFVQFQKGNPMRRRPARRRPDASDIAKRGLLTGEPCCVCYSENGQLTGCNNAHVVCHSCLRMALRTAAGDTLVVDHLICGCFSSKTRRALLVLAERADVTLQETLEDPPKHATAREDFEGEVLTLRRQFDIAKADDVPADLFVNKMRAWFATIYRNDVSHLYHVCEHPACAHKLENWMKIEEFEKNYQSKGLTKWTCPDWHDNHVLPNEDEIANVNKCLLSHPEYYTMHADLDRCPLRRYRLCAQCVAGGVLMLAVHEGACKQWPGYGRGHHHCFCFACARPWDPDLKQGCHHGSRSCKDPGIQQVRKVGNALEVGFVDAAAYMSWLQGRSQSPPPTVFSTGSASGQDRQEALGMTDRRALLEETKKGTS